MPSAQQLQTALACKERGNALYMRKRYVEVRDTLVAFRALLKFGLFVARLSRLP